MKLVFMGTPEFARATLASLHQSDHQILAVVTGRDKPAGRRRKLTPTPVREEAEQHGMPVLMPKSLKSDKFFAAMRELEADLFVVAAFRILPPRVFSLPRRGSINIHTSLLPRYRGAAPIHWAIINGETETGLTSFFLKETVDTGDMILQEKTEITREDTYDTLHARLSRMAGPFLLETLNLIERGESRPVPQTDVEATRAPKITPEDGLIDFGMPARRVCDFVRGLATKPGAYTYFQGKKTKLHFCVEVTEDIPDTDGSRPGQVLPDRKRLLIQCGKVNGQPTAVEVLRIVPEGKREMDGRSFVNGFRPEPSDVFGERVS
ncbi:methionyl-tRNA formyltransferase [candidate division GN15 bacterium]|nr:methionyl-tRNA formyltransferase [candidate division GN15 bacterium]